MKALFEKGMVIIYANPKMTDIEEVHAVSKELEKREFAIGCEDNNEDEFSIVVCAPTHLIIEDIKWEYQEAKKAVKKNAKKVAL